jgi:hypothetical protein
MKLFIATRWGNPYETHGPDGKDTNFLVRASDLSQAAHLAEDILQHYPLAIEGNRPVQGFIHCIAQIGDDASSEIPSVIHGPWIEFCGVRDSTYDVWHRDKPDGEWFNMSEEFRKEAEPSGAANAATRRG